VLKRKRKIRVRKWAARRHKGACRKLFRELKDEDSAVYKKMAVLWVAAPSGLEEVYEGDTPDCKQQQSRRQPSSYSPPPEPEVS
jgi:hypothetical protein